jgi:hypothetical protein
MLDAQFENASVNTTTTSKNIRHRGRSHDVRPLDDTVIDPYLVIDKTKRARFKAKHHNETQYLP